MTPDLQARIEKLARKCVKDAIICECQSCQIGAFHSVKNAIATLAEQVIAEKDAEAAGMREILQRFRSICRGAAVFNSQFPGVDVGPWVDESKAVEAALSSTAGRDLLAERDSLRERVREMNER